MHQASINHLPSCAVIPCHVIPPGKDHLSHGIRTSIPPQDWWGMDSFNHLTASMKTLKQKFIHSPAARVFLKELKLFPIPATAPFYRPIYIKPSAQMIFHLIISMTLMKPSLSLSALILDADAPIPPVAFLRLLTITNHSRAIQTPITVPSTPILKLMNPSGILSVNILILFPYHPRLYARTLPQTFGPRNNLARLH